MEKGSVKRKEIGKRSVEISRGLHGKSKIIRLVYFPVSCFQQCDISDHRAMKSFDEQGPCRLPLSLFPTDFC